MTTLVERNATTPASTGMRWGRIAGGGILLELLLIVVLVPPLRIFGPAKVIPFVYATVPILSFVVARWILRKVQHRPVAHGVLIGIIATALYLLLCLASPDGFNATVAMYGTVQFILGNGIRIVGSALGGYVVQRKLSVS